MRRFIGAFADNISAALLAAIFVIVLIAFVARYFLHLSLSWPEELARYVAVWLTFIGAGSAAVRGQQISVDLLPNLLPARFKLLLQVLIAIASIGAIIVLFWASWNLLQLPSAQSTSPGAGIARYWIYLAPIAGCILILAQLFSDVWHLAHGCMPVHTSEAKADE